MMGDYYFIDEKVLELASYALDKLKIKDKDEYIKKLLSKYLQLGGRIINNQKPRIFVERSDKIQKMGCIPT